MQLFKVKSDSATRSSIVGAMLGVLMIRFVVKDHPTSRAIRLPPPPCKSGKFEITWTVLPILILFGLFGWGAKISYERHEIPPGASDIHVVGKQWTWKFEHENGTRELNELHVPVGEPIRLVMASQDVIHSFFVPEFRLKQDVPPGRYTYAWFQATRPGSYRLFCTQYRGLERAHTGGRVIALSKRDYERWLETGQAEAGTER